MLKHLSVLEQSAAVMGQSAQQTISQATQLAIHCEALGYERFWVSEHHSHPSIVGTAPEVLMAHIAAKTQRIRLGSAGVMLPHYSSLKVAEQFRVLDALAPGRIDLGVGRAPGSDSRTAMLLNPDPQSAARFPTQVQELQLWLNDEDFPVGHPARGVHAYPTGTTTPEVWILGSSDYGAQVAAHFGLPYVFAHFITDGVGAKEALDLYFENFKPSKYLAEPKAIICAWSLTADTEENAIYAFRSRARNKIDRNKGLLKPMQDPQYALEGLNDQELKTFDRMCEKALIGNPEQVLGKLNNLCADLNVQEVAIITWAYDFQVRLDSYQHIAKIHQAVNQATA
ncbi:LLM class flavin-dependent oxidoreductase [Polynucleobacter kasalickyi]|uniref:Luciferase family oxidoreductase, group 1 n=1 Tax=Polynucleobacter kasalickyi TaxID=1938817 RepID=A0A1W1ZUS2_9BURK|nr:LLM class flavin-dependent oxidoreductase [Polynucleobacter kasalickyi]SMC52123.1 luciferase family oxidoreductase, group 1 [Polynucleobacter kasalickyi]